MFLHSLKFHIFQVVLKYFNLAVNFHFLFGISFVISFSSISFHIRSLHFCIDKIYIILISSFHTSFSKYYFQISIELFFLSNLYSTFLICLVKSRYLSIRWFCITEKSFGLIKKLVHVYKIFQRCSPRFL